MSKKSPILIIIQFSSLAYFVFFTPFIFNGFLLFVQIIGFIIAVWGLLAMRIGNFNIQPEVKPNAVFINKGPYKIIRNPMYFGLISFFGVMVLQHFNLISITVYLFLVTSLMMKINMEEAFLSQKFGKYYTTYKANTYRLIPFVY